MKNDFIVSSIGKILVIIFVITAACGIGLMFHCGNFFETPMVVDIRVTTNPSNGENLDAHEFYINDSIDIFIEVLEKDIIDTIAFGALIDPNGPISKSDIEMVRDSIRTGNSIGEKNHFPIRIGRPCTVLLVAIARSKGSYDFDTLRIKIVEQPNSNKAPMIRLEPSHKYAAPSLPCSLKVFVTDAEPWQKESLSILIPDESIEIIDSALCIYKPAQGETSGSKSFSIIVRDNGNPRKSDTAHVTIAILDDGEVFPPPQNARVVQRPMDSVTLAWDADSLADGYRIYRSLALNGDSADSFETTAPWFIDATSKNYFYRIAEVNFFGPSESKATVFGCDTLHYALSVAFLDSDSTASEDDSIFSIKINASQKAKKDILIHVSGAGISANQADFSLVPPYTTMESGDSIAAINLQIINDTLEEGPETFMVTIDSVSSGYLAGRIKHTVTILGNDSIYTVTYDKNGADSGKVPVDNNKYKSAAKVTILGNTGGLKKTGFTFSGWDTTATGNIGTAFVPGGTFIMKQKNIILYAQWTTKPIYTLAYNGNGNSGGSVPNAVTGDSGVKVTVADKGTLEKTNYSFTCWNTMANGMGTDYAPYSAFIMPAADDTLYAKWTINQYTVSFDAQGGSEVASQKVNYGSTATAPTPPTKTGYRFEGWYKEEECLNDWRFSTDAVTANKTLYAKWTLVYTVTYNGNEQTSGTPPNDANAYTNGQTVTILDNTGSLTKSGFVFAGWNTNGSATGANRIPGETFTMGSVNVILYAKWTPAYTVLFDGQEATTPPSPTTKTVVSPATTIDALPTPPIKTGYLFGGWYTAINGGGTEFTASSVVTANDTVYAKWNHYEYAIRFDGQGAAIPASPTSKTVVSPATTIDVLPTPPSKTGYLFGGWYTAINGGGTEFTASSVVTANDTVYAKWNHYEYTIIFDDQGATVAADPTTKTVSSPATTIDALPTPPTKTGYSFGGWFTAIDGGGAEFTASSVVAANDTVYAKWNITYTITFDGQGATTPANPTSKNVISPATTLGTLPTPPLKTGYTFGGWYTAINGGGTEFTASSVVIANDTVYARWNSTIYFDGQGATTPANPTSKIVIPPATTIDVLPAQPTRTGYSFGGWYTAINGGGTEFTASSTVTVSDTVYAKWTAIIYSITYHLNEGTNGSNPSTYTIESPTITLSNATKYAYVLYGWYSEAGFSTKVTSIPTGSTGNKEFWARWVIKDLCGNYYTEIKIGNQVWMVENLKTYLDKDGFLLTKVEDNSDWSNLTTPGYCYYQNNQTNVGTYGSLYNWYAVASGKLAPSGWHVPTDDEWRTLTTYLGDVNVAGGKLKEAGTAHWNSPNTGATNETGFFALPGGSRSVSGTYLQIGIAGTWWTATGDGSLGAWVRTLEYDHAYTVTDNFHGRCGFSVRCIRDY